MGGEAIAKGKSENFTARSRVPEVTLINPEAAEIPGLVRVPRRREREREGRRLMGADLSDSSRDLGCWRANEWPVYKN